MLLVFCVGDFSQCIVAMGDGTLDFGSSRNDGSASGFMIAADKEFLPQTDWDSGSFLIVVEGMHRPSIEQESQY